MSGRRAMIAAVLAVATLGAQAATQDRWLHVRIDNPGEEERVRVNLPLALVEQILPLVNSDKLQGGRVRIDVDDAGEIDLRAVWGALRKGQDGEYATVEDGDSRIKVRKAGGMLLVDATEAEEGSPEKVAVRLPLAVVDALFGAGTEELDLLAAVRALGVHAEGSIVEVEDGEERVRVWIDAESGQKN